MVAQKAVGHSNVTAADISSTLEERIDHMEVRFSPELEKKLNDLAALRGRPADEIVQDAVAGMFDELAETRKMLDSRYDDIRSGRVKLIDGEEAFAELHKRIESRRKRSA